MKMSSRIMFGILFILFANGEELKDPCLEYHFCNGTIAKENLKCRCDEDCHVFGDCCPSMPRRTSINPYHGMMECSPKGYVQISKCPEQSSNEISNLCMNNNETQFEVPVIHESSGFVFKNKHCAHCHNILNMTFWNLNVNCPILYNEEANFTITDLVYKEDEDSWGIWSKDGDIFHYCTSSYTLPSELDHKKRDCDTLISSCKDNWPNDQIKLECSSQYAPVYSGRFSYRNIYCATCLNRSIDEITCSKFTVRKSGRKFKSFSILMDMNPAFGDIVGQDADELCPPNHTKFAGECRKVSCGLPDYKLIKGKCIKKKSKYLD